MKRLLIILAAAMSLTGCLKDRNEPGPASTRTFTIALVSGSESAMRVPGEEDYNENRIERLDIFFFDAAGAMIFYPAESQMTRSENKVTLSIPESLATLLFNKQLTLHMMANCNRTRDELDGLSLDQLTGLVQTNAATFNSEVFARQSSFLMDGSLPIDNLNESKTDLGTVTLQRAAAKVIVKIVKAEVEGYTPVEASVRFNYYLDKTTIGSTAPLYAPSSDDYRHSHFRPAPLPNGAVTQYADPFYSYSNDWEFELSRESYVTIKLKWHKDGVGEQKDYFYRIPFNYIPPAPGDDHNYRIRRNYIYEFDVDIGILGGLDPEEMVDLEPNFQLRDWTTETIEATLNQYDYLVVAETDVVMHNITYKEIHYTSSKPVSVQIDSVFFRQYKNDGTILRQDVDPAGMITANEQTGNIEIDSPVPINFVPLYMYFKVRNTAGLVYNVRVTQYPPKYLTSKYSTYYWDNYNANNCCVGTGTYGNGAWNQGKGNPPAGQINFNFYTITTTALDPAEPYIIGDPTVMMESEYFIPLARALVTKEDAVSNNMISPQFVIASHRGVIQTNGYEVMQVRCATYWEGPYPQGTWRIPTVAELKLISYLQRHEGSALKDLFIPGLAGAETWWTAQPGQGMNVTTGEMVSGNKHGVRCVHDVWKD